jgi:hypothetical protein
MNTGNYMIDGDDGSHCFSPYHNSSKCELCKELEEELEKEQELDEDLENDNNDVFESEHKLPFLVAEYPLNLDTKHKWICFKVGTCEGLWRCTYTSYEILALKNKEKGNGHLNDVFQWFEMSSKRDNKTLKVKEVWNERFQNHLQKRGFKRCSAFDFEKTFKNN